MELEKSRPFLPAGFFAAVMFAGYSLPTGELEKIKESRNFLKMAFSDFSLHFFIFALLAFLLGYGFSRRLKMKWAFLGSGLTAFGYGVFIEFWQGILPYRTFNFDDLTHDFFGALFGLAVFWGYLNFRSRK